MAEKLKELRKKRGVTQEEVADAIAVRAMSISRYERGAMLPSVDVAMKLAKFYEITLEELMGDDAPPAPVLERDEAITRALEDYLASFDPDDPKAPSETEREWLGGLSFRESREAGLEVTPSLYDRMLRERRAQMAGKLSSGPRVEPPPPRPGRHKLGQRRS